MQEWLTPKQIHELYPEINVQLVQAVARRTLAHEGLARKIGDERRGVWLVAPSAIPGIRVRVGNPGRKARQPTDDEKIIVDRVYRLHGSVASVRKHFGIRWDRARAWLVEVYGPDVPKWPGYQYPVEDIHLPHVPHTDP